MNDKERLEFIVGNWEYGRCVRPEDVEWLIEQVEKSEHLNSKYNDSLDAIVGFVQQLQQAQAKAERYKQALEEISNADWNLEGLDAERELDKVTDVAFKALEGDNE